MGGRVALILCGMLSRAHRTTNFESASPGLELSEERMARKEADDALAQKIEANGIDIIC